MIRSDHSRLSFSVGEGTAPEVDWAAVYRSELPRIYNFFRYRVGEKQLAEDLTAATFERAWAKRYSFGNHGSPSGWLYRIAVNVAREHFRRRARSTPALPGLEHDEPEMHLDRREESARLAEVLRGLPERRRLLVSLKYGAGLTNREISRITGMSESNVGTTLQRTLAWLRDHWENTHE